MGKLKSCIQKLEKRYIFESLMSLRRYQSKMRAKRKKVNSKNN